MAYNSSTDFISLLRNEGAGIFKPGRMPGLDYVIMAMGRAGLLTLVVSDIEPVTAQETTVWLDPTSPSHAAEGQVKLWNGAAYVPATATLYAQTIAASGIQTIQSGVGAPGAGVGKDGDFYIRTDVPGGTYGPKAVGAWPADPIAGGGNHVGAGIPAPGLGVDGNWYGRTDTPGGIYTKAAGVWTLIEGTAAGGAGGPSVGTNSVIRTNQVNIKENIDIWDNNMVVTADDVGDTIDKGTADDFLNGDVVYLETTGTLPAGLAVLTPYYVTSITANTLQLAATFGGAAIDITDAGTGVHTIYRPMNGMSASPIAVETGFAVTVKQGSTWSII